MGLTVKAAAVWDGTLTYTLPWTPGLTTINLPVMVTLSAEVWYNIGKETAAECTLTYDDGT